MTALEDRVRRALDADLSDPSTDQLLHDVHLGARRRRARRQAALGVAASVAVVVAALAVALPNGNQEGPSQPPTKTPSTSMDPLPSYPMTRGVVDVSVAGTSVFRLTMNDGCSSCSTVWRQQPGGWERLRDFTFPPGSGSSTHGPIETFLMAPNARDGWAWGDQLYSTHDGGQSWHQVRGGPARPNPEGPGVSLAGDHAWSLYETKTGSTELWRSAIGDDNWTRVTGVDLTRTITMGTAGDRVLLYDGDRKEFVRLRSSLDGQHWRDRRMPCPGMNFADTVGTTMFTMCPTGERFVILRSEDFGAWQDTRIYVDAESTADDAPHPPNMVPLAPERVLLLSPQPLVFTPGSEEAVDFGLEPGEEVGNFEVSGEAVYMTVRSGPGVQVDGQEADQYRLAMSVDGGVTWHPVA